jgi:hypothetical protein
MTFTIRMSQLARYLLIGGGVMVLLSAALYAGGFLMKRQYESENEKFLEAVGRELSGTNWDERERLKGMRTTAGWLLGLGAAAMCVGGAFHYYGSKDAAG